MSETLPGAWLIGGDGSRRRVGEGALLIGRDPGCDVVLSDGRASGRQALIRIGRGGLELHPLGRNPTCVNGEPIESLHLLGSGDVIGLPGQDFEVEIESKPSSDGVWLLKLGSNAHRIPSRPLTVGSASHDDLVIQSLPPGAMTFFRAGDGLLVEVTEEGFFVDGLPLEPDEVHPIGSGRVLTWGPVSMTVDNGGSLAHTPTTRISEMPILRRVTFQYLPTGGRLTVDLTTQVVEVSLSELRCRLVLALLSPPAPYVAGEFVPGKTCSRPVSTPPSSWSVLGAGVALVSGPPTAW